MTRAKSHDPGVEGVATRQSARAFLVLTLLAALVGLGRLAVSSAGIAQGLFVGFLAALLVTLIAGLVGGLKMATGDRNSRVRVGPDSAGRSGGTAGGRWRAIAARRTPRHDQRAR